MSEREHAACEPDCLPCVAAVRPRRCPPAWTFARSRLAYKFVVTLRVLFHCLFHGLEVLQQVLLHEIAHADASPMGSANRRCLGLGRSIVLGLVFVLVLFLARLPEIASEQWQQRPGLRLQLVVSVRVLLHFPVDGMSEVKQLLLQSGDRIDAHASPKCTRDTFEIVRLRNAIDSTGRRKSDDAPLMERT